MLSNNEIQQVILRDTYLADELVRQDSEPLLALSGLLVLTKSLGSYPSAPRSYYACQPLSVLGAETEGGTATLVMKDCTLFALNLGNAVPPIGTTLIATNVRNRWCFRWDG